MNQRIAQLRREGMNANTAVKIARLEKEHVTNPLHYESAGISLEDYEVARRSRK